MITFIAPYLGLKQLVDKVIESHEYSVSCHLGNLTEGLSIAKKLESQGRTIFISRGGTAKILQENISSQVMEIRISFLDLLEVFKSLIDSSQKIGVVGFASLVEPSKAICSTLGIKANYYIVEDENEVFQKFDDIQDDGIEFIVGDVISVRIAEKYQIEYHLIESGEDSICEVIENALIIQSNLQMELEKLGKIRAIFNSVKDGILSVDEKGNIDQFNTQARDYLQISGDENSLTGQKIEDFIPESDLDSVIKRNKQSTGKVFPIHGLDYAFYSSPIVIDGDSVGAVTVFQPVKELQKIENKIRKQLHKKGLYAKYTFNDFISESSIMRKCLDLAKQYSRTISSIMIIGETGTGKELMAQSIHNNSKVKDGPFIALNCGALPPSLMESELFGYAEGSFTGAMKGGKTGLIEIAHNGTLFLDEINSLDINLQSKLLRVIQEREIMKIGDNKIVPVNIRILSASNSSLSKDILEGRFRKDLYYRLNVLDIYIPSLIQRKDDIFPLFNYFMKGHMKTYKIRKNIDVGNVCKKMMKQHLWPGNIRELENWAEKCAVLYTMDNNIQFEKHFISEENMMLSKDLIPSGQLYIGSLKEIEKKILKKILNEESGNISKTASRLKIDRNTLKRKLSI